MLSTSSRWRIAAAIAVLAAAVGLAVVPGSSASADVPAPVLLSQNRPATASTADGSLTAAAAVDGNTATRWSSVFSDPQWIQIDLGQGAAISQVVLTWETAYASAFQIQVSNDAAVWTTIYSTTAGTGGVQTLNVIGSARYMWVCGSTPGPPRRYSLWAIPVCGGGSGSGTLKPARCRTAATS